MRTVLIIILIAVISLGGCNMQNRFLYFPSAEWPTERMLNMKK